MDSLAYFGVTHLDCSSLHCEDNNLLKGDLIAGRRKAERPLMPSI